MKKVLMVLCLILVGTVCHAAPFIVCDPQAGVTHYDVTGPGWVQSPVPAQPDGSVKMDISMSAVGENPMQFKACMTDPVWGVQCSDPAPFVFTRPARPATITGVKLSQ